MDDLNPPHVEAVVPPTSLVTLAQDPTTPAPASQPVAEAEHQQAPQQALDGPGVAAATPPRRSRTAGTQTAGTQTTPRAASRPRQAKRVPTNELADLRTWLNGLDLGISPAVHINGAAFTNCILAVDFGTPRKSVRLNTDQSSELVTRLRAVTKTVMARDVKVGVMTDHSAGIWWTTVT